MQKIFYILLVCIILISCGGEGFYIESKVKEYAKKYAKDNQKVVKVAENKIYSSYKEMLEDARKVITEIPVIELLKLQKKQKKFILLDVRLGKEFKAGSIKNAQVAMHEYIGMLWNKLRG